VCLLIALVGRDALALGREEGKAGASFLAGDARHRVVDVAQAGRPGVFDLRRCRVHLAYVPAWLPGDTSATPMPEPVLLESAQGTAPCGLRSRAPRVLGSPPRRFGHHRRPLPPTSMTQSLPALNETIDSLDSAYDSAAAGAWRPTLGFFCIVFAGNARVAEFRTYQFDECLTEETRLAGTRYAGDGCKDAQRKRCVDVREPRPRRGWRDEGGPGSGILVT